MNQLMNNDYIAYAKQLTDDRKRCVRQLRMKTDGHRKSSRSPRPEEQIVCNVKSDCKR